MVSQQDGTGIAGGLLHNQSFRRVMSWPIWGGPWSYLVVETDPGQELDCIRAMRAPDIPEARPAVFGPAVPASLDEMLAVLTVRFPRRGQDNAAFIKLDRRLLAAEAEYLERGSEIEFEGERQKELKMWEWKRILNAVSPAEKAALFAWSRSDRDQIYREITGEPFFSPVVRWYIAFTIEAIKLQEGRWRNGASMGFLERMLFWFWNFLMILGVIIPDVVNFFISALLAVIRSLPTRPQGMAMAFAIMDFPFADERLSRTTLFQRFLGALPTIIFGIMAAFHPGYRATAFRGFERLWWKGLLAIVWQIAMQNWKNVFDLLIETLTRLTRLSEKETNQIKNLLERLELCNAYSFVWFETYSQGNRFRAQVSNHKQDHGDVASALRWSARLQRLGIPSEDNFSKFCIWFATLVIGAVICASTFPVDAYAGLIALAYYSNIIAKMLLDVWDFSQNYDDVLRFFTATVGPTFPSTVVLLANLIFWAVMHKGIFRGVNLVFWIVLVILFIMSLYPKFWGEIFKRFGLWLRSKLARRSAPSSMELQSRQRNA